MRIHLKLSRNSTLVPFNYQRSLVSSFHHWLGKNELHDDISLYSLSWLHGGSANRNKTGLIFEKGAHFSISAPQAGLLGQLISGMEKGVEIGWGMHVQEVKIELTPKFGTEERFITSSPVFIQRSRTDGKGKKFYYYSDAISDELLTNTLHSKLKKVGMSREVKVRFDRSYHSPKKRKITFNKIDLIASVCPVIISGHPDALAFAWNVGVGNSTGIGFGALK